MNDYMTKPLAALLKDIVADGIVDAAEVKKLRERVYADNVVEKDEADFLFQINDAVSGNANDPSWAEFFVEAITKFLLEDEVSPGVIDADEAAWLISRLLKDGTIDSTETKLLKNLAKKSKSIPANLTAQMKEWGV